MARSVRGEPLFNSSFALVDASLLIPVAPLAFPIKQGLQIANEGLSFISFSGITIPPQSIDTRSISVGNDPYERRVVTGMVTGGDVTIRHAALPTGFDFFLWFYQSLYGRLGPRRNFYVFHLGRDKKTIRRTYSLEGCIPTTWTPVGDLDAASSEVSIEELTMSCERVVLDLADVTS